MVDLAGSERVKDSGVSGKSLKEACQINLSLFHLARVVKALEKSSSSSSAVIPYKDDILCHLLKDSLCGSSTMVCRTSLLAMISPSQLHANETTSTLSFAMGCSKIKMKTCFNQGKGKGGERGSRMRPWQSGGSEIQSLAAMKLKEAKQEARNAKLLPWTNITLPPSQSFNAAAAAAATTYDERHCIGGQVKLNIGLKYHSHISVYLYYSSNYLNNRSSSSTSSSSSSSSSSISTRGFSQVAVLLHGYPSHSMSCYDEWLIAALTYVGFVVLCIDMPGCGINYSQDIPPFKSTRSEFALDKDGPADLIVACVNALAQFDFQSHFIPSVAAHQKSDNGLDQKKQDDDHEALNYPLIGKWGESKVVMIGTDWGGGIALMMGGSRKHKAGISHIVGHLPSFQEKKIAELIKIPTLILWTKDDQFHSYSSFLPISKILKSSLSSSSNSNNSRNNNNNHNNNVMKSKSTPDLGGIKIFGQYQEYIVSKRTDPKWTSSGKERSIIRFLTGIEYLPEAQTISKQMKKNTISTKGEKIVSNLNIVFRPKTIMPNNDNNNNNNNNNSNDESDEDDENLFQQARSDLVGNDDSDEINAVKGLKQMILNNSLENTLIALTMGATTSTSSSGSNKNSICIEEAKKIFPRLPCLGLTNTVSPSLLRSYGLWSHKAERAATQLLHQCNKYPRYFPTNTHHHHHQQHQQLDNKNSSRIKTPQHVLNLNGEIAKLIDINEMTQTVIIEAFDDNDNTSKNDDNSNQKNNLCRETLPLDKFLLMNQRHIFPTTLTSTSSKLVLEDGLTCNYNSSLTKAKMCQIAISISNIFEQIDDLFLSGHTIDHYEIESLRHQLIHQIRKCLNITTFQRCENNKNNISGGSNHGRDRHRYCKDDVGKFGCYGEGHCHTVSSTMTAFLLPFCETCLGIDLFYREDSGGHHQWLEYTLLCHQMNKFTCDLYRQDGYCKNKSNKNNIIKKSNINDNKNGNDGNDDDDDKYLSLPIEQTYPLWIASKNSKSISPTQTQNRSDILKPASVLKVMTGKAIQSAPLEAGDLP